MQAITIKQQTPDQATNMKLSAIARVKACCLTCRPRISPALPVAVIRLVRMTQHSRTQTDQPLICGRLAKLNTQPKDV